MANNGIENVTGITKVNETDIICGRGGLALKHPGNAAYRKIVGVNKGKLHHPVVCGLMFTYDWSNKSFTFIAPYHL